jgi:hypothetical protein
MLVGSPPLTIAVSEGLATACVRGDTAVGSVTSSTAVKRPVLVRAMDGVIVTSAQLDPRRRVVRMEAEQTRHPSSLWVPNRSSMSGDLGIFMYQPTESVATSEVQAGL